MRNSQATALGVSLVACAACVTLAVLALHHRTLDSEPSHRQQIPQDIRLLRDTIARTTELTERFDDAERDGATSRAHPRFVYHRFPDANGNAPVPIAHVPVETRASPLTGREARDPARPAPENTLYSSLWKRSELPPHLQPPALPDAQRTEILEEHRSLSKSAYEHSLAFLSQRALEPPGGPLPRVAPLPLGNATELKGMYHVVVTADGGVYGRWQTLVNYYSYQKVKAAHLRGAMGGYTRVLHAAAPDDIHHLVPTVLVSPLPPGLDRGYGPMHRPWALAQWLARARVREQYIFMTEPDHVFVAPPALRATPAAPAAYPFWYVDCRRAAYAAQCARRAFNEKGVLPDFVATIGNSPTVIAKAQLAAMLPRWDRVVRAIHADGEADAALGWAQEMFAFALALANTGATPPHVTMQPELLAQPPFGGRLTLDKCAETPARVCQAPEAERTVDVSIIHYTYGQDYDERGNTTYGRIGPWHWDKRDWGAACPLLPIARPPAGAPESVVRLVELIEEAGRSAQYQLWWLANMPQA